MAKVAQSSREIMTILADKTAIIFGAAGGIGTAAATLFAQEGANLVLADSESGGGDALRDLITKAKGRAVFLRTDVSSPDDMKSAVAKAVGEFGRLQIIFNCAGGSSPADGLIDAVDDEEFWRTMRVDLYGTWLACKHGIPEIERAGGGSIVNMTSAVALRAVHGINAYTAAKGGVAALTRAIATGYASRGIRVNAIAPGAVRTPRLIRMLERSEEARSAVSAKQPLGMVEPIEVARMALYLASDQSRTTTGQIFTIDGGATL